MKRNTQKLINLTRVEMPEPEVPRVRQKSKESDQPSKNRTKLRSSTTRASKLLKENGLVPTVTPELERVMEQFQVALTTPLIELIKSNKENDAISKQFLPSSEELTLTSSELKDPIGDIRHSPLKGIVHRYPDRVLLMPSQLCPVYCRYCFRRELLGNDGALLTQNELDQALAYIAADPAIWEVILSGGDPLLLSKQRLHSIFGKIQLSAHVKVIRIHSRVPIVDPARITSALVSSLKGRAAVYLIVHVNHPDELTDQVIHALGLFVDQGIPVLSQSVLLRGINDSKETLEALFRRLVEVRVKPYYLHHPDLVKGTSHFRVTIEQGQSLMRSLRGTLSGIAQPTYVLDIPGGHGKSPLGPSYARAVKDAVIVEDYRGNHHIYHDDVPPASPKITKRGP